MKAIRYELGPRLAVGGMAEVFLASARSADGDSRTVVVKRILPQYSDDPSFKQMFFDEATITARLDHPNIVGLVDMGRLDDHLFLALEYVQGIDLEELVLAMRERGEKVPFGIAAYVMADVLRGLHHAHTRTGPDGRSLQIVHRDVTPANVLLALDGVAKISDFGIAKAEGRYSGTQAGVIKGNFQYMSPEQVTGDRVDHRADVYGAGMVLRVLVTGQPPQDGDSVPRMIARVMRGDFPPLGVLVPEAPAVLEALVSRATAQNPDDRFSTAEEFRQALIGCAEECGGMAGALDLALLIADCREGREDIRLLGTNSVVLDRARSDGRGSSVFATHVTQRREVVTDEELPTTSSVIPPGVLAARPAVIVPPPPPAGAPPPPKRPPRALFEDADRTATNPMPRPAVEPDATGRTVVPGGGARDSLGPVPADPDDGVTPAQARASPSKATDASAALLVAPLPTPLVESSSAQFAAHRQSVSAVAFADPFTLVSAGNDQMVRVWDLGGPSETTCFRGHSGAVTSVAVGPGDVVVSGSRDKTARVWRLGGTACEKVLMGHTGWVFAVAVSHDGLIAASGGVDKTLRLWDIATGSEQRVLSGHEDTVSSIAFLADGRVISASYDQTLRLWGHDGTVECSFGGGRIGSTRAIAVSPDSVCAVSAGADGPLRVWDLERGVSAGELGRHDGPVVALAFVPGTALIASASYDGTARVWHLGRRKEIARLDIGGAVTALAAAPTGNYLAMGNGDGSLALWAPG